MPTLVGGPLRSAHHASGLHELDVVVRELRELERRTGLQRTLAVGRLVFEKFFDGSVQAWRERRRSKHNSVRRLAAHPDCPLSRSALNQAIGVFVTTQHIPSVQTFGHIGASHIASVAHLALEGQKHWLERAEKERWGVRELKKQLVVERRLSGERRGRPKARRNQQLLSETRRSLDRLEQGLESLALVQLEPDDDPDLDTLARRLEKLVVPRFRVPRQSEPAPAMGARVRTGLREAG